MNEFRHTLAIEFGVIFAFLVLFAPQVAFAGDYWNVDLSDRPSQQNDQRRMYEYNFSNKYSYHAHKKKKIVGKIFRVTPKKNLIHLLFRIKQSCNKQSPNVICRILRKKRGYSQSYSMNVIE